jgi:glutamate carboxypeptidase
MPAALRAVRRNSQHRGYVPIKPRTGDITMFTQRTGHQIMLAVFAAMIVTLTSSAGRAEPLKPVYDKAQQFKNDALSFLGRLVSIDSGAGDEQGVNGVGALVTEELKKLEARVEISSAKPAAGDNIVATLTGSAKGKVLLIAHMDTVFAKGTVAARPFRIANDRAYGPGVSDNKGGVVTP